MNLNKVVVRPLITEKTIAKAGKGQYCFEVSVDASKGAVEKAVEEMFKVDVVDVRTLLTAGKFKRVMGTRRQAKMPKWKKAIVSLKEGQSIKLFETKE